MEKIVFRNIVAKDLSTMIDFTLNYNTVAPTNKSATPILRDVTVENCTFTMDDTTEKANAGEFDGLPESPIQDIKLIDCDFNGGHVTWDKCNYVVGGVCLGTTNSCPPCFKAS
ncbi:hypothetical protein OAV88_04135 [bacterium]|nr:hypothetical protein [bacterium]